MHKKNEREVLLDSKVSGIKPLYLGGFMFVFGLTLLSKGLYDVAQSQEFSKIFPQFIVGGACLYGSGFRKKIYFSREGIVKETTSWLNSNEEVLPWRDIRHVTLAFKKNDMLGLFERGALGWKVLCDRKQEGALRVLLEKYIPSIEIDTLGK